MRTNCVNCGAAIDGGSNKCPYCGTSYYDFTDIDFASAKPVAVRYRINKDTVVTFLGIPTLGDISIENETADVVADGCVISRFTCSRSVTSNVSFRAVPARCDGSLIQIKTEK